MKEDRNLSVDPVRDLKAIKTINKLLADKPRDLLLRPLGINKGLRASDLLRLKVGDVRHMQPSDTLQIIESKTGKQNILVVNKTAHKALVKYLGGVASADDDFLDLCWKDTAFRVHPLHVLD